jgi:hypothetical protein
MPGNHLSIFGGECLELYPNAHLKIIRCDFMRDERALRLIRTFGTIDALLPGRAFGLLRPGLAIAVITRSLLI